MIGFNIIQAGIIWKLKQISAITSLVTNSQSEVEIREAYWRGTDFEYPNIRVGMQPSSPVFGDCENTKTEFSVYIFSESTSSKEVSDIQNTVMNNIPTSFIYSSNGTDYLFSGVRVQRGGLINPVQVDLRTWQSEIRYQAMVSLG